MKVASWGNKKLTRSVSRDKIKQ